MNFLEICQDFVREFGIAGGSGPATVENQIGELGNVVRWIRDANLDIENQWNDWDFLWAEHRRDLDAVTTEPELPAFEVRIWHTNTFCFNRDGDRKELEFVPWKLFTLDRSNPSSAHRITLRPDGVLVLDAPTGSEVEFYGECQREPVPLKANEDVPKMPTGLHRLIVVRAAIMYGNREDAPEIISGGESEYLNMIEKLEGCRLPGQRLDRNSENFDYESEIGAIPGF